jgi:hypothetical protein
MLYVQHNSCNIIFKMKNKLRIDSGSASPPPQEKIVVAHLMGVIPYAFLASTVDERCSRRLLMAAVFIHKTITPLIDWKANSAVRK